GIARRAGAQDLVDELFGLVNIAQRRHDDRRMHGDRTIGFRVVPISAGLRMDVAVEREPDEPALRVDERAAGIAADGVVARDVVEARIRIELVAGIEPYLRELERLFAGRALVEPRQGREGLDVPTFFLPSLHGAVAEPQRERRVRIGLDRKSTRLNSSRVTISSAVSGLKEKRSDLTPG